MRRKLRKCKNCAKEYNYCIGCDCEVTIKLKRKQIHYLLGAISLGINAERWCALLGQSHINTGTVLHLNGIIV